MKVDKSEKGCPISFEISLTTKPYECLPSVFPLAGARGGGDEGGAALVRAGSVPEFFQSFGFASN
jgi:hypothetical protein